MLLSDTERFNRMKINPTPAEEGAVKYPMCLGRNLIGIEVELENVDDPHSFPVNWMYVHDGSLKNKGAEFVSLPTYATYAKYMLDWLYNNLNEDVAVSHRTSTHIHINYRKDTYETVLNTILLYIVFEPLLYKFVGHNREENIFCVPLNKTGAYRKINRIIHSPFSLKYTRWSKYTGINLVPLFDGRGTIEYRQLARTKDTVKTCVWINTLLYIKKMAMKFYTEELIRKIDSLLYTSQYENFFNEIFGDVQSLLIREHSEDNLDVGTLVRDGVIYARLCIFHGDMIESLDIDELRSSPLGKSLELPPKKKTDCCSPFVQETGVY